MTTYRNSQSVIAMIRRVHSARGRRRAGLYSVEGTRLVERAVRAGATLEVVLVAEEMAGSGDPRRRDLMDALEAAGCPIMTAADAVLAELTEGRDLGRIIGLVRLPRAISLSEVLSGGRPAVGIHLSIDSDAPHLLPITPPPILLAAINIVDPGNVGALTRTAHAAGAAALLAVGQSDPYHPRATRISRGSIFKLPVIEYETIPAFLADLRQQELALIGTAAGAGTLLARMNWPSRGAVILMGNEAEGLPDDVRAALDDTITIPMPAGVDSYSVNAAAAIVLYTAAEALRL